MELMFVCLVLFGFVILIVRSFVDHCLDGFTKSFAYLGKDGRISHYESVRNNFIPRINGV